MTVLIEINISIEDYQKLCKYKYLEIEIAKKRNLKVRTMPVVIGVLSIIAK